MLEISHQKQDFVVVRASGRLTQQDYKAVLPELERQIETHGPLRAMFVLRDIDWIEPKALFEELRFDVKHRKDFSRCAVVGESRWQEWSTRLADTATPGEFRFFEAGAEERAQAWLGEAPDQVTSAGAAH